MIDWWCLIPAVILGACFGAGMLALMVGGRENDF